MDDALHALAMHVRPVKTERGTPIIKNKNHAIPEIERIPQREQKVPVLGVAIAIWTHGVSFSDPPIPMRSQAMSRPIPSTCGMTLRQT